MIFLVYATFLPNKSCFNRKLFKLSVKYNQKNEIIAKKSHVCLFLVKIFMIFPFYATFLPDNSCFNRKLCKRKTQSKNHNDCRKIKFFSAKIFHDFLFFILRFFPVNHVFIASYAGWRKT